VSTLDSLIRLHRWQLDERRRQLADLDALAHRLRDEQSRLASEQSAEQSVASSSQEASTAYGAYARRLIERRRKLTESIDSVERQIVQARELLTEAFREVKRYEIAAASRASQHSKRVARREQTTLDEVASIADRRRRS
jgi:flagellar FliJ protein